MLGAVGYVTAAYSLVLASLLTLALCSVIVILQGGLVDLYARAIGREGEQEDGLVHPDQFRDRLCITAVLCIDLGRAGFQPI